jgi:hypothetical protein
LEIPRSTAANGDLSGLAEVVSLDPDPGVSELRVRVAQLEGTTRGFEPRRSARSTTDPALRAPKPQRLTYGHPAKPKIGLRTTARNEAWQVDVTILQVLDGWVRANGPTVSSSLAAIHGKRREARKGDRKHLGTGKPRPIRAHLLKADDAEPPGDKRPRRIVRPRRRLGFKMKSHLSRNRLIPVVLRHSTRQYVRTAIGPKRELVLSGSVLKWVSGFV